MKKLFLGFAILLLFAGGGVSSYGQLYNTGIGARLGFFNGVTVKHFMSEGRALEGLLATRWEGFIITGLYEVQQPFTEVNNLEWFYGGGLHVGFWQAGNYRDADVNSVLGIDLILGVEYTFDEIPFSLSLDWKPAVNVIGDTQWWGDGVAFSIRYTFR